MIIRQCEKKVFTFDLDGLSSKLRKRKFITDVEAKILKRVIEKQVISASDIKDIFPGKANAEVSRQIKKLIDRKMLIPEKDGTRKYVLRFDNSYLIRSIIKLLGDKGFLPVRDDI